MAGLKFARPELEGFGHAAGEVGVVGDDDEGDALVAVEVEKEVGDGVGGGGVERAGRFVGEDQLGPVDQCSGDGGAELLAAGKLPGEVVEPLAEADFFEKLTGSLFRFGGGFLPVAGEVRNQDVLEHRELGKQVLLLEDEAERVVAEGGGLFLRERGDVLAADLDGAGGGAVEGAEEIEQGRFPAAGGADDRGGLALGDSQIEVGEDADVLAVNGGCSSVWLSLRRWAGCRGRWR